MSSSSLLAPSSAICKSAFFSASYIFRALSSYGICKLVAISSSCLSVMDVPGHPIPLNISNSGMLKSGNAKSGIRSSFSIFKSMFDYFSMSAMYSFKLVSSPVVSFVKCSTYSAFLVAMFNNLSLTFFAVAVTLFTLSISAFASFYILSAFVFIAFSLSFICFSACFVFFSVYNNIFVASFFDLSANYFASSPPGMNMASLNQSSSFSASSLFLKPGC